MSPAHCARRARALAAGALVAAAGCQTPAPPPPPRRRPPARAVFTRDGLRRAARLERRSPASGVAGVPRRLRRARRSGAAHAAAVAARRATPRKRVDGRDAPRGAPRSSKRNFTPYRVSAADGADSRLVTGYYEPLLAGSRTPATGIFRAAVRAARRSRSSSSSRDLYPELKDKRVRGRLDGRRVVPYWPRADIERGKARRRGQGARVRRPIRSTRSSCRSRARGASRSPTAASCASATPTRTASRSARSRAC